MLGFFVMKGEENAILTLSVTAKHSLQVEYITTMVNFVDIF